ncbi:hypothetical protein FFRU_050450 [Fructobacillus fructosus]|uniref:hypothetical protein n=1 Tax=Fructobacillus fructosus TaxID=1631 RepID=UPI0002195DC9|nr:hypothetical protein [Fructobacillus fructosus]KRN52562.1 hypothetical protein IV71_GL001170 [Fructobacillus fructosus KCTC 3544]GAP01229.1 hypothetical protein FFRU_050450 [Fructobacillus fructosus]
MLIITKIQTKELKAIGPAEVTDWEDLAIPKNDFVDKKTLITAVVEAYDLGKLQTLSHISSPSVLKATVEKDGQTYHLSAKINQE